MFSPDPSPKETEFQRWRPCPRSPREDGDKVLISSCQVFFLFCVETANPGFVHPDLCSLPFFKSIRSCGFSHQSRGKEAWFLVKGSPKLPVPFILLRNSERRVPAPHEPQPGAGSAHQPSGGHVGKPFCLGAEGLQQVGRVQSLV